MTGHHSLSLEIWPEYAVGMILFSSMLFRSSKLRKTTSHCSRTTLDHMLRVLYMTTWHSRMLMCYHGKRIHPIFHPLSTSGIKRNDGYIICKISQWRYRKLIWHWSVSGTISHKHFVTHWLDQYVTVAKPASMQMVDTQATNLVNVHKTHVLFKTSTQWIQVYLIHYLMKFVSDLRQVSDFLWVLIFFFTNTTDIAEILLKVALSTITLTPSPYNTQGAVNAYPIHFW